MQKLKANDFTHLSDSVWRALIQNKITTVLDFLQEDVNKLPTITKLSLTQVIAIRSEILNKYSASIISGITILDKLRKKYLCTGLQNLDAMLEGGIPIGSITEICGLADTGKTQLCFQLAINCAKSQNSSVLFIDTKGDFSAIRIQKILDASGFSHKEMAAIMYRIKVVRVWTMEETIELLQSLKNKTNEIEQLALVILDSIPCLMLQFLGDENKIGLTMLNTLVNYSRYLCKELDVCMIAVNIETRWIDHEADIEDEDDTSTATTFKEVYIEKRNRCLGKYWQCVPNLVLHLGKIQNDQSNGEQVKISVMKYNNLRMLSRECIVNISALGIK